MAIPFKANHNLIAYLTKESKWGGYHNTIDQILRSKFVPALTINPPLYLDILREFWENAEVVNTNNSVVALRSTVCQKVVAITPATLSKHLLLNDANTQILCRWVTFIQLSLSAAMKVIFLNLLSLNGSFLLPQNFFFIL